MSDLHYNFTVTGIGLMEKGSLESKGQKAQSYWGHRGDNDSVDTGHTEYLTRLTSLRDSLIKQEQLYLARAIDRLRMQSMSNKSSSDRLRNNLRDVKKLAPTATRPSMMTTVEKFRQMRPRVPKPEIHPLVGKQLLVGNVTTLTSNVELLTSSEGSVHSMGLDGAATRTTAQTKLTKNDDIVESNLLRLSQTTCSIQNIGRGERTSQDNLEPKTKSIHSLRSTYCKQKGRLFLPFQNTKSLNSSLPSYDSPEVTKRSLQSQASSAITFPIIYSRGAWKRDVFYTDNDVDEEEEEENHNNGTVNNRSETNEHKKDSETLEGCRQRDRSYANRPLAFCKTRVHNGQRMPYSQSTTKKRKDADFVSRIGNALFRYNNSSTVNRVNRDMPSLGGRVREYIHGVIQLLPDRSYRASIKNGIVYVHGIEDESDVETLDYTDTGVLDMAQFENDTNLLHGTSHDHITAASASTIQVDNILVTNVKQGEELLMNTNQEIDLEKELLLNTNIENNLTEIGQPVDGNKTPKKCIIVDMPKIIFNYASAAQDLDDSVDEVQNENQHSNVQSPLRMVAQQQQVRIKELTSLLEDVKELSLKTEALKLQSAI